MMHRFVLVSVLAALPGVALAADPPAPAGDAAQGDAAKADAAKAQEPVGVAPQQDAPFKIRRGFFAETDLGVYFTFGGRNTNDVALPSRGISNVQPFLGITAGYDIVHGPRYSFSLGVKLAVGYSGGAGRVTGAEVMMGGTDLTTRSSDFAVMEAGVAAGFAYMVSDRLAVTAKLDGGAGIVDPNPKASASDTGAGGVSAGGLIGAGLGIEYFTLLNDFSVGLDLRYAQVLAGGSIPSASVTIPIKYTF